MFVVVFLILLAWWQRISKFVTFLHVLKLLQKRFIVQVVYGIGPHVSSCLGAFTVLAKVYKEADVEETGVVDAAKVPSLATKILGSNVTEHETQLVVQKTEAKGTSGKYGTIESAN